MENVIKQNIVDIRRYFEGNIHDKCEVEKALKITLLEIIRSYHRFSGEVAINTWLLNIARQVLEGGAKNYTKARLNQQKIHQVKENGEQ
ncbi:hypothetical protein [Agarilytica rhodophyticola]|uniref:hypothetical protein n=1 Tax=Agarilytica rhodophyticola TaxID=1737490 RepID=UPI000B3421BE|nr:hypothetical protein [Agarilytica rhodophyticola]